MVRPVEVKAQVELLVNREGRVKRALVMAGRNPGHRVKFTIRGDVAKELFGVDSLDGTSSINLI
ncbi:hypothetical protein [Sulfuracidifex metallicus]|uniref:hypothetical protein n=1 Tax=Sulfuracidifex metallicus TaxID=47303 RepID=UPI0023F55CE8|nr:hypothetical protein [Sulfuracidifex metallicus]